ncbi:hypothetical protein D5S17_36200 [Pseudonocardiaceae bacterium YIM PH 21723]|nr:hypothetical protein D5S17_36200 [Pseudonocardiaceae bacterium YIM PH 21723]
MTAADFSRDEDRQQGQHDTMTLSCADQPRPEYAEETPAKPVYDGPCATCHVAPGRHRGTRLRAIVCGRCWSAHGGKPAAGEIGPAPLVTVPLRYPSGQQHWTRALARAQWVQDIRVDGNRHLLKIARVLARYAGWESMETRPTWAVIERKTGLSRVTIQRWLQELKVRGWIRVVETGSTPVTRGAMALILPDGQTNRDKGNRAAVYALQIPFTADEAVVWAVQVTTEQFEQAAVQPAELVAEAHAELEASKRRDAAVERCQHLLRRALDSVYADDAQALYAQVRELIATYEITSEEADGEQHQDERDGFALQRRIRERDPREMAAYMADYQAKLAAECSASGDKKGSPSVTFPKEKSRKVGSHHAQARVVVDDHGKLPDPSVLNCQNEALRARIDEERSGRNWGAEVPVTEFEMLAAADWLRRRLTIFGKLGRKAVRRRCRAFWRRGWSGRDFVHAVDHLPGAFGRIQGQSRVPGDGLNLHEAATWVNRRLDAWRHPDTGRPLRGHYQDKQRSIALSAGSPEKLTAVHGAAALRVLGQDEVLAGVRLTPGRVAEFGRRVADQMRRKPDPAAEPEPVSTTVIAPHNREKITDSLREVQDKKARRQAEAERHQQVMDQHREGIAQARARIAANTGHTDVPLAPSATSGMTAEQRAEHTRRHGAPARKASRSIRRLRRAR